MFRAIAAAVGLFVLVLVVFVAYLVSNPASTECFASFESPETASAAVDGAGAIGFDDTDADERRGRTSVTFTTGESGEDAVEARQAFAKYVKEFGGQLGHPGDGCLEVEAFGR